MTESSTSQWYVVQTHPNAEVKACSHLQRQGFQVYLPRHLKRRFHARRVEVVPAPLFPRYLFVAIDMASQRWRAIQSTIGVSRLVCSGERPSVVPSGVVERLRQRADARGFVQLAQRPRFVVGEKIRIESGVFVGCLGLFEGMTDSERLTVLLELLGRKVRVALDADLVVAA